MVALQIRDVPEELRDWLSELARERGPTWLSWTASELGVPEAGE